MAREAQRKRKPAEQRIYTSSPLAGAGAPKVLPPPMSPRPPLSPAVSRAEDKRDSGEKSRESEEGKGEVKMGLQAQLKKALAAEAASSAPSLAVPPENIDERRLSGVGTYGVGLGLLSSDSLSDEEESDDDDLLSPRAKSPAVEKEKQRMLSSSFKPEVPTSAPIPVGLGITVPSTSKSAASSSGTSGEVNAKHAALFAAATQPVPPAPPSPTQPTSSSTSSSAANGMSGKQLELPDSPGRDGMLSPPPPAYSLAPSPPPGSPKGELQHQQQQAVLAPQPRPVPRPLDLNGQGFAPNTGPGQPRAGQRGPPMIQIPGSAPHPGQPQGMPGMPVPILRQPGSGSYPVGPARGPQPGQAPYLTPPPQARQSPFSSPQHQGSMTEPLLPPRTPGTPSSLSPHPLPPSSPITPLFAAPRSQRGSVRFSMAVFSPLQQSIGGGLGIMRSEKESALPVRTREPKGGVGPNARVPAGEGAAMAGWGRGGGVDDGDAFWRRFSMVAKEENRKPADSRHSGWLARRLASRQATSRLLVFGVVLGILCLGGGIGCAWYFTHRGTGVTYPVAIGGSANEAGATTAQAQGHVSTWVPPIRRKDGLAEGELVEERGEREEEARAPRPAERDLVEEEREGKRDAVKPRATGVPGKRSAHAGAARRWAKVAERGLEELD